MSENDRPITETPQRPEGDRRCGKTSWMVDRLCEAVKEGQPKSVVYGRTMDFCITYLQPMIVKGLVSRGITITKQSQARIEADGSVIILLSLSGVTTPGIAARRGYPEGSWGEFWDHCASDDNDIRDAVLDGLREEFAGELDHRFFVVNSPIVCEVDGRFFCEVRVNVLNNMIEVWISDGVGFSRSWCGETYSHCSPFLFFPLESPDCFDRLFSFLRAGGR